MKAIDILTEALKIFTKNSNFVFFAAIASLPLLCFSLYFENRLHGFLSQVSKFHEEAQKHDQKPTFPQDYGDFIVRVYKVREPINLFLPLDLVRKLSDELFREFLHLGFLYLVPFNLLQLGSLVVVVDSASKLYREGKALTLRDMFGIKLSMKRLQGVLVTFLLVVLISTCVVIGFVWLLITYISVFTYFSSGNEPFMFDNFYFYASLQPVDLSLHVMYGSNLVLLSGIYLTWSCIWNLGLVMSVMEDKHAAKALGSSSFLCLRNVKNGMVLMALLSAWELGLRLLGLLGFMCFGNEKRWGSVVAQSGLFCLESAVKWVAFVVYFDVCVKRLFVKKVNNVEGEES